MADQIMKRMNYFDHQFLRAKDFNDEQSYHLSRRYLHNRVMHTAGIAQGLQVRKSDNRPSAVVIDSGIAIDILGREIVLANDKPLDLPNLTADNSLYLYIEYAEQQTDQTNETGTTGFTRWTEEPVVASTDNRNQLTATQLFLARVSLTAEGILDIDMSGRTTAGLANDDLSVRAIRLKKDGVKESAWPRLSCSAANEASLGNGSLSIDDGRELFFRDNGQIRSSDDNHKIVFNRANNRLELREFGTISFYTGAPAAERMTLLANGNVGIGRTTPGTALDVKGETRSMALTFADVDGKSYPSCWIGMANNIEGSTRWLHIGGIMDAGERRITLQATKLDIPGKVNIGSAPSTAATFPPEVTNAAQKAAIATAAAATATAAGAQAIVALSGQAAANDTANQSVRTAATATQAAQAGKIAEASAAATESSQAAIRVAEMVIQAMAGGVASGAGSATSASAAAQGVGDAAKQTIEAANQSKAAGASVDRKDGDAALQAADDTSRFTKRAADFVITGMDAGKRAESLLQNADVSNLMKAARDRAGETQQAGVEVTRAIEAARTPLQNFKSFKPPDALNGKLNVYGDQALGGNLIALNGKVGIGTPDPSHRLHVNDILGIRQNRLYLSGNEAGSSLSYNAHRNANNSAWVFPDPQRAAVTVEMDDSNNKSRFEVFTTKPDAKTSWVRRFAIDGSTGEVTVDGNLTVSGDLTVKGKANIPGGTGGGGLVDGNLNLDANKEVFFKDNGQIRSVDNNHRILFRRSENRMELREYGDLIFSPGASAGNETAKVVMAADGNVVIKNSLTVGPVALPTAEGRFHICGKSAEFSFMSRTLTAWPAQPKAGDRFVWYNPDGTARLWTEVKGDLLTVTADGNVGIGTTPDPKVKLDVNGVANIWSGTRYATVSGFMAPGSLTIGNTSANFGGGVEWNNNNPAALLLETLDNTEIAVHDAGRRLASLMYYEGGDVNRITIGRQMGPSWGAITTLALNGKVGIGTPTPATDLEVSRSASNAIGGTLRITNSAGGSGAQSALEFVTYNSPPGPPGARVLATDDGNFSAHLDFMTKTPGAATNPLVSRLRINSNGSVSIAGTTGNTLNVDLSGHVQLREYGTNGTAYFQARDDSSNRTIGFTIRTQQASPSGTRNLFDSMVIDGVGNVSIRGSLSAGGGKGGYVVDKFVNNVGETLEVGDVVVLGKNQTTQFYGMNDYIPIPEIDFTDASYDTRICGIVCEVHVDIQTGATQNVLPPPEVIDAPKGKTSKRKIKAEASAPPPAPPEELAVLDTTRVGQGQVGLMVTLGAFAHCKVDADIAPIEVGDLLTTSPTRAHAQKVTDTSRAVGAIIGKALGSLKKGKGKVPIMVTLQ